MLLENLNEEEGYGGNKNHPQLWMDFAKAFEAKVEHLTNSDVGPKARELVEVYFKLCRSSFEEGLGALYAYEHQVPEIAEAKIEGLKKFYGISDEETTAFFEVHKSADKFHSEACAQILNSLSPDQQSRALAAAKIASEALWNFLTEVYGQETYAA
jgi:pyrroloquinoline-quinone synthase